MAIHEFYRIIWLAIAMSIIGEVSSVSVANEKVDKFHVYIDPSFGGKENGPLLINKYKSKDMVLTIGKNLKQLLETKDIAVDLSRHDDSFVAINDRIAQAKINESDIYVNLRISLGKNNCIRVYYPKGQSSNKKEKSLNAIVESLTMDARLADSIHCATIISKSLTNDLPSFCIKSKPVKSFILEKTYCPAIMLDFSVVKSDLNSYLLNPPLMEKILSAVAKGVENYIAEQNSQWRQRTP